MAKRAGQRKKLATVDKLLGVPSTEGCLDIEVARIRPFKDHPFKVIDDEKMHELVESIMTNGVLTPVIIRQMDDGDYQMISGHRSLLQIPERARIRFIDILGLRK